MRNRAGFGEDAILRVGAILVAAIMLLSARLAAELAREHMASLGAICGAAPHPHCGWCYAAAALFLAALAACAVALRPPQMRPSPRRA